MDLDIQQRTAIKRFLDDITSSTGMKWDKKRLFSWFDDYELDSSFELDISDYISTLKGLPFIVKRDFTCRILTIWSFAGHKDFNTLFNTIQSLLKHKIETGVEFVLFNNIFNLSSYFGFSIDSIRASTESNYYTIDVWFNADGLSIDDQKVHFSTSSKDEQPLVDFYLPDLLLRKEMRYSTQPSKEDVKFFLDHLHINHFPWIQMDYSVHCDYNASPLCSFFYTQYRDIHIYNH